MPLLKVQLLYNKGLIDDGHPFPPRSLQRTAEALWVLPNDLKKTLHAQCPRLVGEPVQGSIQMAPNFVLFKTY